MAEKKKTDQGLLDRIADTYDSTISKAAKAGYLGTKRQVTEEFKDKKKKTRTNSY